jgi:hypothetical protein
MSSCKFSAHKRKNVVVAFWLAWVAVLIAQLSYAEDRVIDIYTFPDIPIKEFHNKLLPGSIANDREVLLGSVGSDLWRGPTDPRDEFWMVTDRGPNGQIKVDGTNRRTFLVPEFNPMILRVKTQGKEIRILEALPIVGQSGKPVNGLPNLTGMNETPYNYSGQELLNFNPNGLDTEGLVRTTTGDFWIAEEYGPSLVHADRTGKVLKRYIPEGLKLEDTDYPVANALPAIYGKTKINRGFEGLALSNDEKTLYIVLQSPLLNPDRKTGNASRNTRVLVFDIATEKVTAEYVYRFDVSSEFDRNLKNSPDEMKLSGVAFLSPTTLLVLERTDSVAKLYSVDISKATNILNTRWDDAKTAPALEALDDPALAQVRVLPKSLVLDLSSLAAMPEKLEGIALLDRHTIAVASDNDFDCEDGRYDAEGNAIGKGKKTQILVISLAKPLPLPLDSIAAR